MKNIILKVKLIVILAFILIACSAQNNPVAEINNESANTAQTISNPGAVNTNLPFEVNINFPYISLTRNELNEAKTLLDLNPRYKADWVNTYNSVKVSVLKNGSYESATGSTFKLNPEQKALISSADADSPVTVMVKYIPENNLSHNDEKETSFITKVTPENPASFSGGAEKLLSYIQEHAINKIPEGTFKGYDLAAITFTISETGVVTDAEVFEPYISSTESELLLLSVISDMPNWTPAQYADGTRVSQDFVLTVGNMANCKMPLLEIRE